MWNLYTLNLSNNNIEDISALSWWGLYISDLSYFYLDDNGYTGVLHPAVLSWAFDWSYNTLDVVWSNEICWVIQPEIITVWDNYFSDNVTRTDIDDILPLNGSWDIVWTVYQFSGQDNYCKVWEYCSSDADCIWWNSCVWGVCGAVNNSPTATIIGPLNWQVFTWSIPYSLTLTWVGTDDWNISALIFSGDWMNFTDTSGWTVVTGAYVWTGLVAGTYAWDLIAMDNLWATGIDSWSFTIVNGAVCWGSEDCDTNQYCDMWTCTDNTVWADLLVSITAPQDWFISYTGDVIIMADATPASEGAGIQSVTFISWSIDLFVATEVPYWFTWTGLTTWVYTVTAIAADLSWGIASWSATFTVQEASWNPPSIIITSPTSWSTLLGTPNATIPFTVTVADDWQVEMVEYFSGVELLWTWSSNPYSYTRSNVTPWTYTITAVVTDNEGLTATDQTTFSVESEPAWDDSDADWVPDDVESNGPNSGDANYDWYADESQEFVATLPSAWDAWVETTFELLPWSTSCSTFDAVSNVLESSLAIQDEEYRFPYGVHAINIPCTSATLKIWFHWLTDADIASYTYRKYDGSWWISYPIIRDTFAGSWVSVPYILLDLVDWGPGDSDGVVNWIIMDPSGLGEEIGPMFDNYGELTSVDCWPFCPWVDESHKVAHNAWGKPKIPDYYYAYKKEKKRPIIPPYFAPQIGTQHDPARIAAKKKKRDELQDSIRQAITNQLWYYDESIVVDIDFNSIRLRDYVETQSPSKVMDSTGGAILVTTPPHVSILTSVEVAESVWTMLTANEIDFLKRSSDKLSMMSVSQQVTKITGMIERLSVRSDEMLESYNVRKEELRKVLERSIGWDAVDDGSTIDDQWALSVVQWLLDDILWNEDSELVVATASEPSGAVWVSTNSNTVVDVVTETEIAPSSLIASTELWYKKSEEITWNKKMVTLEWIGEWSLKNATFHYPQWHTYSCEWKACEKNVYWIDTDEQNPLKIHVNYSSWWTEYFEVR